MKTNNRRGFTLIELLVVVSIIGTLSSIVVSSTNVARSKGRDAQRVAQFKQIHTALELYYDKHQQYPALVGVSTPYDSTSMEYAWSSMLDSLKAEGFIATTENIPSFADNSTSRPLHLLSNTLKKIGFYPKQASASIGPSGPTNTSPQDPLYPRETYAYVPSNNHASFRIRTKLENINTILNTSVRGVFYDASQTTGDTACDISLKYYCLGSNLSTPFTP